jgi:hypothetical protein
VTQEDRKMARKQNGDQVMGEVSPGGTEGGRGPTEAPLVRLGWRRGAEATLDCSQKARGGAAYLPGRAPVIPFQGVGGQLYTGWESGETPP